MPLSAGELAEAVRLQAQHDARQSARDGAVTSSAPPLPAAAIAPASASASAPAAVTKLDWHFAETEEHAASFNTFQQRLTETTDYSNPGLRPGLIARVNTLVTAMRASSTLRQTCFALAPDAILSCRDRLALGLNDMELTRIDHEVLAGNYSVEDLLRLGEGFFKLQVLNEIATKEIARQRLAGEPMDEVEIRLVYQVALREQLNLPGVGKSMRYVRSAHVTPENIEAAAAEVETRCRGSDSVNFLAQWAPWDQAMKRTFPTAYDNLKKVHQERRDGMSTKPRRMKEGEWIMELEKLTAQEASDIKDLTAQKTREILERLEGSDHD